MIELALETATLEAGRARSLALRVRATAPVLLEDATFVEGGAALAGGPAHAWKRHPEGVTTYDPKRDRYVHVASLQGVSAVPLHGGILPAGGAAECFVAARRLSSGRITLAVRYRVLERLEERLYLPPPSGISGSTVIYARATELRPGLAIVREEGLHLLESRASLEVAVAPDASMPPRALARLRWGWLTEQGLRGVPDDVLDAIERLPLGDPIVLTFRGGAGARVRAALDLGDGLQGWIEPEHAPELFDAIASCDARARVGTPWEGVVVS